MEAKTTFLSLESLNEKIEDLMEMVREGFNKMVTRTEFNERFDKVDAKLNAHDRRLDHIEDDLRRVKVKIGIEPK